MMKFFTYQRNDLANKYADIFTKHEKPIDYSITNYIELLNLAQKIQYHWEQYSVNVNCKKFKSFWKNIL